MTRLTFENALNDTYELADSKMEFVIAERLIIQVFQTKIQTEFGNHSKSKRKFIIINNSKWELE